MLFKRAKLKREEEMKKMKADAAKKAGIAFVAGSAIAAVVTLFTAPKSGKEMRQDVANKVEEGADKIKEHGEFLVVKTAEVMDSAIETGKRVKEKFTSKKKGSCCCDEPTLELEEPEEILVSEEEAVEEEPTEETLNY